MAIQKQELPVDGHVWNKMAPKLKIEKRWDEILIVHCCFSVS
jgi:hypothetical protein